MQGSTVFERIYFPVFMVRVDAVLCMICFRFSGAVVSVRFIIGILVVACIIIGLSFFGSIIGMKNERNKNCQPSYHFRVTTR